MAENSYLSSQGSFQAFHLLTVINKHLREVSIQKDKVCLGSQFWELSYMTDLSHFRHVARQHIAWQRHLAQEARERRAMGCATHSHAGHAVNNPKSSYYAPPLPNTIFPPWKTAAQTFPGPLKDTADADCGTVLFHLDFCVSEFSRFLNFPNIPSLSSAV